MKRSTALWIAGVALGLIAAIILFTPGSKAGARRADPEETTHLSGVSAATSPVPAASAPQGHIARAVATTVLPAIPALQAPAHPAIGAFRVWAARLVKADSTQQSALVPEGMRLAREHRAALKHLITTDPRTAIEQAVPMVLRQQLPPAIIAELEQRVSGRGSLEMYVATPAKASDSTVTQHIVTLGERTFHAQFYGRRAGLRSLPEITVNGVAVDRELAVSETPTRALEIGEVPDRTRQIVQVCPVSGLTTETVPATVTADTPAVESAQQVIFLCDGAHIQQINEDILAGEFGMADGWTGGPMPARNSFPTSIGGSGNTGVHNWLYLRVVFPDRRTEPQTEADAYAKARALTDFYQENSYGRLTFAATVTPLIVLPHTEAWYINQYNASGDIHPLAIMADARDAAREAGFTTDDYQKFTVCYTSSLGNFSGVANISGATSWVKTTALSVVEHEMGHNLGCTHSNAWDTGGASVIGPGANVEYGHPKDTMGGNGASVSNGHFNAAMKQFIGWLAPENYHTVLRSGTYRIFQFDQPSLDPARRYALKVAKDADRDYWMEFRQKPVTSPWWMSGASVNWSPWGVSTSLTTAQGSNTGTQLLDMTPGSPDGLEDSPLVIGRTFSDFETGVHMTPVGKGGTTPESLDIVVNVGAFPGNQPPVLALAADNLSIAAGGTVHFTATASDPDGDALAYYWEFGDKLAAFNGVSFSIDNAATQAKTFANAGYHVVQCTVSDMKGGTVRKTLVVTVGAPATFTISGTITNGGAPVADVLVTNGLSGSSQRWSYTDSDGNYVISNLNAGNVTLSALKAGLTFTPSGFSNPVVVGPNQPGCNFTATAGVAVSIAALDPVAAESGGNTGTFRITRTGSTAASLTVYTDITGSATIGTDYTLTPAADTTTTPPLELFTIPAGSATRDITVTPVGDALQEGPETVVMSLIASSTYVSTGPQTATVTIDDANTTLPRLNIVATTPETTEGSGTPGQFTISRTGSTAAALTVFFAVDASAGNATNGADYANIGGSVVIPAGASEAVININAFNDGIVEGQELLKLALSADAGYLLPSPAPVATLKINDADINVVSIAATDAIANENGDTGRFTFTRTGGTSTSLLVYYSTGGTALNGVDYQTLPGFITFAAGSATATVDVVPINDSQGEPAETVRLQIRSGTQYQFSGTGNAVVTINDDGDLPVVTVGASAAQAAEGASPTNGTFLFTTTGTGAGNITVHYTVSGTATSGADYTALSGTLSMPKNGTASVTVAPLNDAIREDAESVILTIQPDPAYTVDLQNSATVIIRDDDSVNMISVSTTNAAVSEATPGQFYFSRAVSTASPVTVRYAVSGTATPGTDYTALPGTVVIAANTTGTFVNVTPLEDNIAEGTETVMVTLLPDNLPTPTYGIETGSATMNISDNDAGFTANVGFASASVIKQEDAGTFMIDVARTGSTAGAVSVEYAVQYGTATGSGVDFLCPPGRLDFAPGETVKSIPFTIVDDITPEDVEAAVLQLRNASGAAITSAASQFTVMILDNEPRVTIEATDPFAYETGDTAQFTVRRYGTTAGALVVPITVGGTATGGADYAALPASVTILNGASTATLTLTPVNNPELEPVETVTVTLAASSNASPGAQTSATVFIGDAQSNNPPFVQIISPKTVTPAIPGGVGLIIDALVTDETTPSVSWSQISGPGTATFTAPAQAGTGVTFSANGVYLLRLSAADGVQTTTRDLTVTVGAAISPWTGADIGAIAFPGSATEQNGLHAVNGSGTTLTGSSDSFFLRSRHLAGDGEIRARVRYMPAFSSPRVGVILRESTAAGSPMAALVLAPFGNNADLFHYRKTANAVASSADFGIGVTASGWVRVVRSGDNFSGYDSPDGVTWTQRGATQSIAMPADVLAGIVVSAGTFSGVSKLNTALVDNVQIIGTPDNTAPGVSAGQDGSVQLGMALALNGSVSDDALPSTPGITTVQWTKTGGPGAVAFADANALNTTVTFNAAGTYVLRLTADDGEVRTFDEATITVTAPVVSIVANVSVATELGLTPAQFTVIRTGDTSTALTVFFSKNGTATEGADYGNIGTQVVIPAFSASATITVTPLADTLAEGDETVGLTLFADAAYIIGSSSPAVVTIADLPMDDWRHQHFGANANVPAIAGDNADPNHNGLSNLLEYALALDPISTSAAGQPVVARTAAEVSLTYIRRSNAPDITLNVEWSDDLTPLSWSTTDVSYQITPLDAARETVKATVGTDVTISRRFLRLKVMHP
jgi:hypothetical protein